MKILKNFIDSVYDRNPIHGSDMETVFSRFGIYQVQAYKDTKREYIVLMSRNFLELYVPNVYVLSLTHLCVSTHQQIELIMQRMYKEGGLMICHSAYGENIDRLLHKLKVRKLQRHQCAPSKTKKKVGVKLKHEIYKNLGFVIKDLNLSHIKLIAKDPKVMDSLIELGITIVDQMDSIEVVYGEANLRREHE